MKFFSRKLCEKLHAIGCKSEAEYWYLKKDHPWDSPAHKFVQLNGASFDVMDPDTLIQAFSQNDFTGCHKQALKNAKIAWENPGDGEPGMNKDGPDIFRHMMIDANDAEKYLEEWFS